MRTLKQALAEKTEEQLKQLASWWGIGDSPEEGWKHHYGLFIQRMQDPVAIRFAWEQINEDERKVLHNLLTFSASNSILHDVLLKITRLPETNFEQALTTLKDHMLILEEPTTLKYAGAASSSSSKVAKPASTKTTKLIVVKELQTPILAISNEINAHNLERSHMKLEYLLSRFGQERLYEIGHLYGFVLYDYYSRTP